MAINVTPEQHGRLKSALENWPERLSWNYTSFDGSVNCTVAYLGAHAGLKFSIEWKHPWQYAKDYRKQISELYGIPVEMVEDLENKNGGYLFGQRKRSKGMRERFEGLAEQAEVHAVETAA